MTPNHTPPEDGLTKEQRYYRKSRADPSWRAKKNARQRKDWSKGGSERRAERYFRHRGKRQKEERNLRWSGLAVVTAKQIAADDTIWRHPDARREEALEKQATQILAADAKANPEQPETEHPEILPAPAPPTMRERIAEAWTRRLKR